MFTPRYVTPRYRFSQRVTGRYTFSALKSSYRSPGVLHLLCMPPRAPPSPPPPHSPPPHSPP
eukprot:7115154-Prymnesium_polylepis.1